MLADFGNPLSALQGLQRSLESRLESDWIGATTTGYGAYPPINIFQQGDDFVAIVELPGIDRNDLQIEAKENMIRISGTKRVSYGEKVSVHRRERSFGVFDRTISLPLQIDADAVRAEYGDGILSLFIPRAASEKPRVVKIS
jgi:HSP20 family protein